MIITAEFNGVEWIVKPDPATVRRGENVEWRFQTKDAQAYEIEWTAYFDRGSPFGVTEISVTSIGDSSIALPRNRYVHSATTPPVMADQPGDFKYGVRAFDHATNQKLGDDDPKLIVRP